MVSFGATFNDSPTIFNLKGFEFRLGYLRNIRSVKRLVGGHLSEQQHFKMRH